MKKMMVIILLLTFLVGCSNENNNVIDVLDEGRINIKGTRFSIVPTDDFESSNTISGISSEKYQSAFVFIELPINYSPDEFVSYYEDTIDTYQTIDSIEFISSESFSENEILVTLELEQDLKVICQIILMKYNGKDIVGQIHASLPKEEYESMKDNIYKMLKSINIEDEIMEELEKIYSIDLPKDWKLAENMFSFDFYSLSGTLPHDYEKGLLSVFSVAGEIEAVESHETFVLENITNKKNYKDVVIVSTKDMDVNGVLSHIYYVEAINEISNEKEYFQYSYMMFDNAYVVIQGNGLGILSNEKFEEIVSSYKFK